MQGDTAVTVLVAELVAFLCLGLLPSVLRVQRVPLRGLGWWGAGVSGAMMCHSPSRGDSMCCLSPCGCLCGVVAVMLLGAAGGSGQHYSPFGVARCPSHFALWGGGNGGSPAPFKLLHTF